MCEKTATVNISNIGAPVISISSQTNVTCQGGNNGAATAEVNGGVSPYSYLWNDSDSSTTATISNLYAGEYILTIIDDIGCQTIYSVTITEPQALALTMSATPDSGTDNGTATVIVMGGTSPYSYYWSTGEIQSSVSNLSVGYYSVTVTDGNGCMSSNLISVPTYINVNYPVRTFESPGIYPNPGNENLNIELSIIIPGTYKFSLFNLSGQMLHSESAYLSSGKHRRSISAREQPGGIYKLRISSQNHTAILQWLKFSD